MLSRERVVTALNHQEPDRVPLDLGGTNFTGIQVTAYNRLKGLLKIDTPTAISNQRAQLVVVEEAVKERMHGDVDGISCNPPSRLPDAAGLPDHLSVDEWGVHWLSTAEGAHIATKPPLAGMERVSEIEAYPWPDPTDPARWAGLRERLLDLRSRSQRAISANLGYQIATLARNMRGYEQWCMDLILNPALAEALMHKIMTLYAAMAEQTLRTIGDLVDVVAVSDDLATQEGPMISPATYRKVIKPLQQELFCFIKARTRAKLFYHCCGAASFFLDDFIEAGIDIINPIQVSARNMDPAFLKKTYGSQVTFWGGVDTQHLLPFCGPQEVSDGVKRLIDTMAPGGGFILAPVHNIRPEVPPENLAALFDTAWSYGNYR